MRNLAVAVVVTLLTSVAASAAPVLVTFDGMTTTQAQAQFLGLGNNPVITSDHGGSVLAYSSGNIANAYRRYSPGGVDYTMAEGTISADVKVYFDNTSTHGSAAFKGGLMLGAKTLTTTGTEFYYARIVAKPNTSQILLEIGNLISTGHSPAVSTVISNTFNPGAVVGDLGWYNISATISTVNTDQYRAVVTVTDPNSNVTTLTYTDSGTARYTGAYPVGIAGHNQWSTSARYDNLTLNPVPEPATLSLLALGGLLIARRRRPA